MNKITIVAYDNLNGRSTKLFSVESNNEKSLEYQIAEMVLVLEKKININSMLISKHISISKNRHHVVVEALDCIVHPEDYEAKNMSLLIQAKEGRTKNICGGN